MREQEIYKIKNQAEQNTKYLEIVFGEMERTQSFMVGVMNVLKKLPGYDEAIKELALEQSKKAEELKEDDDVTQLDEKQIAQMIVNEAEEVKPPKTKK